MPNRKSYVDKKSRELKDWKVELDELARCVTETTGELKAKLDNQMVEATGVAPFLDDEMNPGVQPALHGLRHSAG